VRSKFPARLILFGALVGLVTACGSTEPIDRSSFLQPTTTLLRGPYRVSVGPNVTQSADGRVVYHVTIINPDDSILRITYGDCWAFLNLYSNSGRTSAPVFDEATSQTRCPAASRNVTLGRRGDSLVLTKQIATSLLHGLPSGHYFASIRIVPNGAGAVFPIGELDFRTP